MLINYQFCKLTNCWFFALSILLTHILSHLVAASDNFCECTRSFKPVCGSDGKTYENSCRLLCEQNFKSGLKLAYDGVCCPSSDFCMPLVDRVCDNLGETHANECAFSYKQCIAKKVYNVSLRIEKKGPCEPRHSGSTKEMGCNFNCDESLNPVCDSHGHTHKNICKFNLTRCHRQNRELDLPQILHKGECELITQNQIRQEALRHKQQQRAHTKNNARQYAASIIPPHIVNPYDFSESVKEDMAITGEREIASMAEDLENNNASLSFTDLPRTMPGIQPSDIHDYNGKCVLCEDEIEQVAICDNLNQTHRSLCEFARWNCLRRLQNTEERILVHIGTCNNRSPIFELQDEVCPSKCSKNYKPVCDTSAMTFPNLCTFQMYNCRQRQSGNKNVAWLILLKACEPEHINNESNVTLNRIIDCPTPQCPETLNPVCDSVGNVHINDCAFAHARCLAAKQKVVLRIAPDESCLVVNHCVGGITDNCTNEYDPICGTDFTTHRNLCQFKNAQCIDGELEVLFKGECKKCLKAPCPLLDAVDLTTADYFFVCDQNGETKSKCEFDMLKCIYNIKFGYNMVEAYSGRCCPQEEHCMNDDFEQFCDTQSRFYQNRCFFEVAKCRAQKVNGQMLVSTSCHYPESTNDHKECQKSACTTQYNPVCGTDGKTYTNLCYFQLETCMHPGLRVDVDYPGSCCNEKCTLSEFNPVCDSNGVTHLNLCEFGKRRCNDEREHGSTNMTIAFYGMCDNQACNMACPAVYDPVCAMNSNTFPNECELARAICILNQSGDRSSLTIDYRGECCDSVTPQCDLFFEPVCDSEGRTHVNECVFKQEACLAERKINVTLSIDHKGECCNGLCGVNGDDQPVCDSMGITHASTCEYHIQKCKAEKTGTVLQIAYLGQCCPAPPSQCPLKVTLCDSEGQTHEDICSYEHKKCTTERIGLKKLSISYMGKCCILNDCPDVDKPVCDSKGNTHRSMCHFNNTVCLYERISLRGKPSNLRIEYPDECCENGCTSTFDPVCDHTGGVHINKCVFEYNVCKQSKRSPEEEKLIQVPCKKN